MHETPESIAERYWRDGFASPVPVFDPAEIAALRAQYDALEAQVGRESAQVELHGRHLTEEFVWRLATHPRLLDVMQAIVGEDLILLSSQFFCKYPSATPEKFVAWHQDVTYWGLDPAVAHSAWVAVDDVDEDNGCMWVVPGSHRGPILEHGTSERPGNLLSIEQEVSTGRFDASAAVPMPLAAGEVSLHHGMLLHKSEPNRSDRRRCGLAVRFVSPEVRQVEKNSRGRRWRPVLLRGRDRYRHFPAEAPPFAL